MPRHGGGAWRIAHLIRALHTSSFAAACSKPWRWTHWRQQGDSSKSPSRPVSSQMPNAVTPLPCHMDCRGTWRSSDI